MQTLYFDGDGLLKRHDYDVEISGSTPGAHIIEGYTEVSGIKFPTKRRIYARQPDSSFSTDTLVVSIDLSNIRLSSETVLGHRGRSDRELEAMLLKAAG